MSHLIHETPEFIVAAAALQKGTGRIYALPQPNRHCNVLWAMYDFLGPGCVGGTGFITSSGRYVTRGEARLIAEKANQILRPENLRGDSLYSEDLWDGNASQHPAYYPPPATAEKGEGHE